MPSRKFSAFIISIMSYFGGLVSGVGVDYFLYDPKQQIDSIICKPELNVSRYFGLREESIAAYASRETDRGDKLATEMWKVVTHLEQCGNNSLAIEKGKMLCLGHGVERQPVEGRKLLNRFGGTEAGVVNFLSQGFCD